MGETEWTRGARTVLCLARESAAPAPEPMPTPLPTQTPAPTPTPEVFTPEPQVLDIDFEALMANEWDSDILAVHEFVSQSEPSWTNEYTGMFRGVRSRLVPILDPEKTARKIIRAIERNRDFRGIPLSFHLIRFCQGILPVSWFDFIFGRGFGIFSAMDNFTGRKPKKQ